MMETGMLDGISSNMLDSNLVPSRNCVFVFVNNGCCEWQAT